MDNQSSTTRARDTAETDQRIWFVVPNDFRKAAFRDVIQKLELSGYSVQLVAISDVVGSITRDAVAGSAERLLRNLRAMLGDADSDVSHFLGAFRRLRPDALILSAPRYVRALSLLERITGIETVQIGVLPDFGLESAWLHGDIRQFVVPHLDIKAALLRHGFKAGDISIGGPPLSPDFIESEQTRKDARRELGIGEEVDLILVRADGFPEYLIDSIVFQLTLLDEDVQVVFDHQGDRAVARKLRSAADKNGLSASMFGGVENLPRYYSAADLAVVSPEERYIPELLYADCSLFFVASEGDLPQQVDFLEQQDVARCVNQLRLVGGRLQSFLDGEIGQPGAVRERLFAEPDPNEFVAEKLQSLIERDFDRLLPEDPPEYSETSSDEAEFEAIGKSERPSASHSQSTRQDSSQSKADLKDALSELILLEKDLESEIEQLEKRRARWEERIELAASWEESKLASEAEAALEEIEDKLSSRRDHLARVRRRKADIKKSSQSTGVSERSAKPKKRKPSQSHRDAEQQFRDMELEEELEALKDRIDRELGDGER